MAVAQIKPGGSGEPWRDPSATPYIRIDKVSKHFGDFVAVDDVSLDVYKGELFSLLGGSGCGKTTLLRMLAGFETPSEGKIFIDGIDMAAVPPFRRPVNMMFQSYALFPHMTVEGNIAFGLKQDNTPAAEIRQRVDEMLRLVQMAPFAKRKPHQLSGGQRQRVALARSLVKRPKLLLLDEPLGALDKKLREETQFELVNIQEKVGVTFIVVTHDQEEAMTLSSRIAVMNAGRIVQLGTPREIYEYPGSRFVASFLGSVNLFEGRLAVDEPDHCVIDCPPLGGEVFIDHGISGSEGMPACVALRPEKIRLSAAEPADLKRSPSGKPYNAVFGQVEEIAYLGDLSIFRIRLPGGALVKVTQPNVARWSETQFTWEDRVWLSWTANSAVVLTQ